MRKLITRGGIAFIFIVFGFWELINPGYWTGFIPKFLSGFDLFLLVKIHGLTLIALGLGLLSGIYLKKFAIASTLVMLSIVMSILINDGFNDILIRDIVILLFDSTLIFED